MTIREQITETEKQLNEYRERIDEVLTALIFDLETEAGCESGDADPYEVFEWDELTARMADLMLRIVNNNK